MHIKRSCAEKDKKLLEFSHLMVLLWQAEYDFRRGRMESKLSQVIEETHAHTSSIGERESSRHHQSSIVLPNPLSSLRTPTIKVNMKDDLILNSYVEDSVVEAEFSVLSGSSVLSDSSLTNEKHVTPASLRRGESDRSNLDAEFSILSDSSEANRKHIPPPLRRGESDRSNLDAEFSVMSEIRLEESMNQQEVEMKKLPSLRKIKISNELGSTKFSEFSILSVSNGLDVHESQDKQVSKVYSNDDDVSVMIDPNNDESRNLETHQENQFNNMESSSQLNKEFVGIIHPVDKFCYFNPNNNLGKYLFGVRFEISNVVFLVCSAAFFVCGALSKTAEMGYIDEIYAINSFFCYPGIILSFLLINGDKVKLMMQQPSVLIFINCWNVLFLMAALFLFLRPNQSLFLNICVIALRIAVFLAITVVSFFDALPNPLRVYANFMFLPGALIMFCSTVITLNNLSIPDVYLGSFSCKDLVIFSTLNLAFYVLISYINFIRYPTKLTFLTSTVEAIVFKPSEDTAFAFIEEKRNN